MPPQTTTEERVAILETKLNNRQARDFLFERDSALDNLRIQQLEIENVNDLTGVRKGIVYISSVAWAAAISYFAYSYVNEANQHAFPDTISIDRTIDLNKGYVTTLGLALEYGWVKMRNHNALKKSHAVSYAEEEENWCKKFAHLAANDAAKAAAIIFLLLEDGDINLTVDFLRATWEGHEAYPFRKKTRIQLMQVPTTVANSTFITDTLRSFVSKLNADGSGLEVDPAKRDILIANKNAIFARLIMHPCCHKPNKHDNDRCTMHLCAMLKAFFSTIDPDITQNLTLDTKTALIDLVLANYKIAADNAVQGIDLGRLLFSSLQQNPGDYYKFVILWHAMYKDFKEVEQIKRLTTILDNAIIPITQVEELTNIATRFVEDLCSPKTWRAIWWSPAHDNFQYVALSCFFSAFHKTGVYLMACGNILRDIYQRLDVKSQKVFTIAYKKFLAQPLLPVEICTLEAITSTGTTQPLIIGALRSVNP
jgi:hypothetical protein